MFQGKRGDNGVARSQPPSFKNYGEPRNTALRQAQDPGSQNHTYHLQSVFSSGFRIKSGMTRPRMSTMGGQLWWAGGSYGIGYRGGENQDFSRRGQCRGLRIFLHAVPARSNCCVSGAVLP